DVGRAVHAVHQSTPDFLITALESQGLLGTMLERLQNSLGGRPLNTIPTNELSRMAHEAVSETLGIPTTEESDLPSPSKHRATPTEKPLTPRVSRATESSQEASMTAAQALTRIEEITQPDRR